MTNTASARQGPLPPSEFDPAALPAVYAATCTGSCMEPVIHDGTCMAFTRFGVPEPGDFVAIWFWPEHARRGALPQQLKRLAMPLMEGLTFPYAPAAPAECVPLVVVEMINPPRRWAIPATHIRALHRCLGPAQCSADGRAHIELAKLPPEARPAAAPPHGAEREEFHADRRQEAAARPA